MASRQLTRRMLSTQRVRMNCRGRLNLRGELEQAPVVRVLFAVRSSQPVTPIDSTGGGRTDQMPVELPVIRRLQRWSGYAVTRPGGHVH